MGDEYRLDVLQSARRELARLPDPARRRIARMLDRLARDPRPGGAKLLAGPERIWRIRIGDYRLLYRIDDDRLAVLVVKVGHRGDVYRGRRPDV